jgi:hypothetical protein
MFSKSFQKPVKKLSKTCQKLVNMYQKFQKVFNKFSKTCKKTCRHVSLVILCDTGSQLKEKINKRGGVWWGGENSSSKAFGISFADRPKVKSK